ncbi:hypothetical protein ACJX0J_024023, partial [Zea mays]
GSTILGVKNAHDLGSYRHKLLVINWHKMHQEVILVHLNSHTIQDIHIETPNGLQEIINNTKDTQAHHKPIKYTEKWYGVDDPTGKPRMPARIFFLLQRAPWKCQVNCRAQKKNKELTMTLGLVLQHMIMGRRFSSDE